MRAAVSSTPAAGVRPAQRVPRHLRRLVQVPCVLRVQVLRRAAGVPRARTQYTEPVRRLIYEDVARDWYTMPYDEEDDDLF